MARFSGPWAGAIAGMARGFGRLVATLARQNKLAFRNCSSCPPNLAELFRWPTGRFPGCLPEASERAACQSRAANGSHENDRPPVGRLAGLTESQKVPTIPVLGVRFPALPSLTFFAIVASTDRPCPLRSISPRKALPDGSRRHPAMCRLPLHRLRCRLPGRMLLRRG